MIKLPTRPIHVPRDDGQQVLSLSKIFRHCSILLPIVEARIGQVPVRTFGLCGFCCLELTLSPHYFFPYSLPASGVTKPSCPAARNTKFLVWGLEVTMGCGTTLP